MRRARSGGGAGAVAIADYHVTCDADQRRRHSRTAAYMAPEQAKGQQADKRSDIWAFGCVLFEMLTGRRAFESHDVTETLAFVLTKDPDWSALPPELPPAIRTLLPALSKSESDASGSATSPPYDSVLDQAASLSICRPSKSVRQHTRKSDTHGVDDRSGDRRDRHRGDGRMSAAIGTALGLGGAVVLSQVLRTLLFEVRPDDPLTFAAAAMLLAAVSLMACYVPARRAARVDPLIALRLE